MSNQEALEVVAFMLNRAPMNRAEALGVNAALLQLKEAVALGNKLPEEFCDVVKFPEQKK